MLTSIYISFATFQFECLKHPHNLNSNGLHYSHIIFQCVSWRHTFSQDSLFILTECTPGFQNSTIEGILQCEINDLCLGVQCCVGLDFKITQLMLKTWIIIDPCNLTFSIGFENMSFNQTLLSYTWGKGYILDHQ